MRFITRPIAWLLRPLVWLLRLPIVLIRLVFRNLRRLIELALNFAQQEG